MDSFEPTTLAEWETWLERHHERSGSVWVVLAKRDSGLPLLDRDELIATALAFGWVDSLPNKLDDRRYKLRFSPRSPRSNWSAVNKASIARLEAEGRMRPAGRKMVELAKQTGTWTALNDVDALVIHDDFAEALDAAPPARQNWEAFPRSTRRGILEQIYTAKRPGTRAERIRLTVEAAARGERAFAWRKRQ